MLTMVLLDAVIVIFVTFTVMRKLPIRFKILVYKIPTWLLSLVLDVVLLMPASGFEFGAVAALVAEPIIYPMLIWDKKDTLKYVAWSINTFGKIVERGKAHEMLKAIKKKHRQSAQHGKKWYSIFLDG